MFVQPSGLIFLVIIAIWAAYLLQHWVRRREHLATARSVDRFSDAMRVLERRSLLPESDLSAPQPRSYAVSPARSSRPEVVVKRAQSPTPGVPTRATPAVRPTRAFHALAGISARRVRGLSFLLSLSCVVVVVPLAASSVMAWWSVPVAVVILLADFAWLRRAAAAERSARRSHTPSRRPKASSRPTRGLASRVRAPARRSVAGPAGSARSAGRPASRPAARPAPRPLAQPVPAAADLSTAARGGADAAHGLTASAGSSAELDLSGWAPVPVPPPTYTLKAKAERPEPAPAAVTGTATTQPSSFEGLVDEGELDGLLDRRRAAGA